MVSRLKRPYVTDAASTTSRGASRARRWQGVIAAMDPDACPQSSPSGASEWVGSAEWNDMELWQ